MKWIGISPAQVVLNGDVVETSLKGAPMITEIYRKHINDYPKYFKMDGLCKLGFVASELLLAQEGAQRFVPRADRAVVMVGSAGSIGTDRRYQSTIADPNNYFPSPSTFVYTLPNIVTGEIAIRNKYFGETSFLVEERFSAEALVQSFAVAFCDEAAGSLVGGWLDYESDERFRSILVLLERSEMKRMEEIEKQINEINLYI